jgi:hypothetical protein
MGALQVTDVPLDLDVRPDTAERVLRCMQREVINAAVAADVAGTSPQSRAAHEMLRQAQDEKVAVLEWCIAQVRSLPKTVVLARAEDLP